MLIRNGIEWMRSTWTITLEYTDWVINPCLGGFLIGPRKDGLGLHAMMRRRAGVTLAALRGLPLIS